MVVAVVAVAAVAVDMTPPDVPREPSDDQDRLVDFRVVVRRLFWAAVVLAAGAVVGATVQGVIRGLTFAVLVQWTALFALAFVIVGAGLLAAHAIGGARAARRRGERLASNDIGLAPRGGLTPRKAAESLRGRRGARRRRKDANATADADRAD